MPKLDKAKAERLLADPSKKGSVADILATVDHYAPLFLGILVGLEPALVNVPGYADNIDKLAGLLAAIGAGTDTALADAVTKEITGAENIAGLVKGYFV